MFKKADAQPDVTLTKVVENPSIPALMLMNIVVREKNVTQK
jgi:hypothetical protein